MKRQTGTLTSGQRAALDEATAHYLKMHEEWARDGLHDPNRAKFVRLRKACKALESALQPFQSGGLNPERARLLANLQMGQAYRPQAQHGAMIEGLIEPLIFLIDACDREVGSGRGGAIDADAYRFVFMCANAWVRHGCGSVSASEGAAFWRALDSDSGHLDRRVPRLKRDTVRAAVAIWRRQRQLMPAESAAESPPAYCCPTCGRETFIEPPAVCLSCRADARPLGG